MGLKQGIRKRIKTMDERLLMNKIAELKAAIDKLPKGYISKKTVGGKIYFYHQWSESGKKKSKYLKDGELAALAEKIERRKQLQAELAELKKAGTPSAGETAQVIQPTAKAVSEAGTGPKVSMRSSALTICTLMHRNIPVAELELNSETGFIQKVGEVFAPEHLPVGVGFKKGVADRAALNAWWLDRSIPASRSGVREALETLGLPDTKMLLTRCYGLSLSDQYWILPEGTDLGWERINFFQNPFSEDIGDVLFGADNKSNPFNFSSPDNTSDGNLKKRWKIIDGKRYLIKGGSNPYRQQPFNEVIATKIMEMLNISHVPYSVIWEKGAPYSVCEDFVNENTELVPAWRIIQTQKQPNDKSLYRHFVDCAESLWIPGVVDFLDRMIVLDFIIVNEDRHLNNFGALRNAETLEWLGMAPIYDSGSSLGYDKSAVMMWDESEITCKPFKKHHAEQLKLVSSFAWIDFSALKGAGEMIKDVLSDEKIKAYMEESRIQAIADLTERRIKTVESLASSHAHKQIVNIEDEVGENLAASYENL